MIGDIAKLKLNLTLRCGLVDQHNLHPVSGLVAFCQGGDRLWLDPEKPLSLSLSGPFAYDMEQADEQSQEDNLVIKAARAWAAVRGREPVGHFYLEKNLPLASGIGGGSADAAAALRLLARTQKCETNSLESVAEKLGADVPMCIKSVPRFVSGYGNRLGSALALPRCAVVLANPLIGLATKDVFTKFDQMGKPSSCIAEPIHGYGFACFDALIDVLIAGGNDLYPAAKELVPEIGEVLEHLQNLPDVSFSSMSGSGATCFALFSDQKKAERAGARLRKQQPNWWVLVSELFS